MATTPLVTVQRCKSCTDSTPGTDAIRSWTSESAICRGAASSSTSVLSFTSRQALMRTSPPIRTEMRGSASTQPDVMTMTPAMSDPRGDERQAKCGDVSEHVRSVREQRQRTREPSADQLNQHDDGGNDQR